MAKLGVYIIEDEVLYSNKLMMLIDGLGYETLGSTDNSDTAFVEIEQLKPDLLLVDIEISGTMDGIELVSKLNEKEPISSIFITSYADRETFERAKIAHPHAFITKPFEPEDLQRSIELAFNSQESSQKDKQDSWNEDVVFQNAIFIKNRNRIDKVSVDDILYLEVEDRYSTVFTEDGKQYVLRMSMGSVQEKLPKSSFARTHRKYSINLSKIKSIDLQDNLVYIGDHAIPISRSYKEDLIRHLDWIQ